VMLFGDSLAFQSQSAFIARMHRRAPGTRVDASTFPATALCDYRKAISAELLRRRPQVVVLEFSGNSVTPCMRDSSGELLPIGSARWRARYLDDLRAVLTAAAGAGAQVVWATAPPVRTPTGPENYPRLLAGAARRLAATNPTLRVADTGMALTSGDRSFTASLPCRADEGAFCRAGRIAARADDGLHFDCHGAPGPLGGCLGYSAGGRRFGEAMADAAIANVP
jgi:hypothetical protein